MEESFDEMLARILRERELIDEQKLREARRMVEQDPGLSLDRAVRRLKAVASDTLERIIAELLDPPPVTPKTKPTADEEAAVRAAGQLPSRAPAEVAAAMADPEKRFGKYVMLGELGRGGMGVVFKAWDPALERYVAVKVIREIQKPEDVKRFFREARAATSLAHPNIVTVFEAGERDGKPYMVMQYVDGRTVDGAKFSARRAAELIRDAAAAVHAAHQLGIVHRDLKPQNLMVDRKGRVYVLDFGLARQEHTGHTLTAKGIVFGTPAYMAPEMAQGKRSDARADVYMLGATLYALLTGREPFRGKSALEIMAKVTGEEPAPPSRIERAVTPDLETIVLKCMEKEPGRRYGSAAAVAEDLRRFLEGEPLVAKPPSVFTSARRWVGKHRSAAVVGVAGVAAIAVLVAVIVTGAAGRGTRVRELLGQAAVAEREGRLADARDAYRRAAELDPGDAAAREGIRRVEAAAKVEAVRTPLPTVAPSPAAPEKTPSPEPAPELLWARADRLYDQGRYREALEAYEGAARTSKPVAGLLANRGLCKAQLGDLRGAVADYDEAIRLDPKLALAWANRANARRRLEDRAGAVADLDRFLELKPDDANGYHNRGALKGEAGRNDEALEDFRKAVALDPRYSSAWANLSVTLSILGRNAEALQAAVKARDTAEDERARARAQSLIDELAGRQ